MGTDSRGERPHLNDSSTIADLEEEIEFIQSTMVRFLDAHIRRITICAHSKRWWNDDIQGKRQQLGRVLRWNRKEQTNKPAVREARKALRRLTRRARRQCWEDFLSRAYGEDVWKVSGYISPRKAETVPTISHLGQTASSHAEKVRMLADISFPPPTPYEGDEGQEGPPGRAYLKISDRYVQRAFQKTSSKKSPGLDGIGPLAFRCLFMEWDTQRVVALIRTHIRLGVHPARWKLARGVIIPKPGKDDYSVAKAYRCISLLNCLGKMVEKVVANLISDHCETRGGFHPGQYCDLGHGDGAGMRGSTNILPSWV